MNETGPGISPLNHHSDGEPAAVIGSELKTNYKNLAKRYELAERAVWSKLADWKKEVVIDCRINGIDDRILQEYVKEIARLAETESEKLDDTLPEVPSIPNSTKIPDPVII